METGQASELEVAMATWLTLLHGAGFEATDATIRTACEHVHGARGEAEGDAMGMELVGAVRNILGGVSDPASVLAAARAILGDGVDGSLGEGTREERVHRIRKYQFGRSLPWLARIWERADGEVRPTWLLVEQVTDQVLAMDPNPWNDIDEERTLPVNDFQVLWELDGCPSVHLR